MSRGKSANVSTAQSLVGGTASASAAEKIVNPFRMPSDEEVFAIRDDERRRREEERKHQLSLPAQEKGTWGSKAFASTGACAVLGVFSRVSRVILFGSGVCEVD